MTGAEDHVAADGAAGPAPDDAAPATVVDARGLRCPLPVIRLARAAADLAVGELVTVWSTDPAAVHDVPAWARMRGHAVVGSTVLDADPPEGGAATAITVRVGG